jgi:class 3 adenylate cyclase
MRDLPLGTVTFLFTDVEGSTRVLRHLGRAYGTVLGRHRELIRAAVAEHGGHEVDTQGEGFFVAFARAKDAVAAAVAAQHTHEAEPWPERGRVAVRMGMHTAEPELGQAGYFGMGVHRAARICSVGHGGQILLSRSTAGLVDEDEEPGLELRDLGEHVLKDLDRPERIYQLASPGLRETFPPLRSVSELARSSDLFPTGTVTFFVTDVVGSVALLRSLGVERYSIMLERYEEIVHRAVRGHGGHTFEMVGDSFVGVFARARDAVLAGVSAKAELDASEWPENGRPGVRIGIHTGEAERWRSGYVGFGLIRALRVCDAARGGHVLVSPTTETVVDGLDLAGVELRAQPQRLIEDFERPVVLYEAVGRSA